MAKKYLSFLGTSPYIECYYLFGDQHRIRCHFVQEALTRICCQEWNTQDQILIFTTADALKKNWLSGYFGDDWIGLDRRLAQLEYACQHRQVNIPEGNSEEALWQIFDGVFRELEDGDELILDITHAFRSLPMLALIILNYAKFVKNCTLAGIYYGAFEVLGTPKEATVMPIEDRNAPIFDLTPFVSLLDWTVGIDRFLHTGDASVVTALTTNSMQPMLSATKGQDVHAGNLQNLAKAMADFSQNASVCRGKELSRSALAVQHHLANSIQSSEQRLKPLTPLLRKMHVHFQPYAEQRDTQNLFEVVKWCRDHQLVQQGLTLLEESLISGLCRKLGLNADCVEHRHSVSGAISMIAKKLTDKEREFDASHSFSIEELRRHLPSREFVKAFERLRSLRNDINHGGYNREYKHASVFKTRFNALLRDFEQDITSLP